MPFVLTFPVLSRTLMSSLLLISLNSSLYAGSLDAPAAITNVGSAMYTTEDIYNRLDTGATGAAPTAGFTEPAAGPGATGKTLTEVMAKTPVVDDVNGATTANVTTGKTFWGVKSGGDWGVKTGTAYSAPVAKTGQTKCYDTAGTEIGCAGTGQDGELQKGADIASGSRFTDHNDGTVTDNRTGLIWLKNADCTILNPGFDNDGNANDGFVTWQHALDFIYGINAGTYNCNETSNSGSHQIDWRMPNFNELLSLVSFDNNTCDTPLPDGHPFILIDPAGFGGFRVWSATSYTGNPGPANAYTFSFKGSCDSMFGVTSKSSYVHVWPVRGGQ